MAEENVLIEKLLDILDQKNTKLLPQNLRDKVKLLGVTGTLEQKEDLTVELQAQVETIASQRETINTLFASFAAIPWQTNPSFNPGFLQTFSFIE